MKKKVLLFNCICLLGVFSIASLFLFYQVFVDASFRKIPLTTFFRPQTFLRAVRTLSSHDEPLFQNALFWEKRDVVVENGNGEKVTEVSVDSNPNIFFIDSKKYLTNFAPGFFRVTDLDTHQVLEVPIEPNAQYAVLGWQDEKHPIISISRKSTQFDIVKLNLDNLTSQVVASNIIYTGISLAPTSSAKLKTIIYPDCTLKCYFIVYDLEKNVQIEKLPAFTEPSHAASLSDVKLLFVDSAKGYIGYEAVGSKEVYIIDHQLNFLQYIRLENDRDSAQFLTYFPQTQQLLFSLDERDGSMQKIALVAANTPSLHVLTSASKIQSIFFSVKAGAYQLGNTIYDLNGQVIKNEFDGMLISAY